MTAVGWLIQQLVDRQNGRAYGSNLDEIFKQALELEKEQRQKVDKLLDTLLENNMCSHSGDKLIEQFKTDNQ